MKPTVTVVMDCHLCGGDLEWVNASAFKGEPASQGVVVLRCPSCNRHFDLLVMLRSSAIKYDANATRRQRRHRERANA